MSGYLNCTMQWCQSI